MFGKYMRTYFSGLVLIGVAFFIIRLYGDGNINLYIHPRYTIFAVTMSILALAVLMFSFAAEEEVSHHEHEQGPKLKIIDIIVLLILVLAYVLPAKTLSSTAISRKSINTPVINESFESNLGVGCPAQKPRSIAAWVYEIGEYPVNCYENETITMKGFVFSSPSDPLPPNMYYLGQVVMSCCVVDARPFGLPVVQNGFERYPDNTWLEVSGKLVKKQFNGETHLVIDPTRVEMLTEQTDSYQYLNSPTQ